MFSSEFFWSLSTNSVIFLHYLLPFGPEKQNSHSPVLRMEHNEATHQIEAPEPGSQREETTETPQAWRCMPRGFQRDTEPGEIINEFQNDMSEHNPGLQRHHDRMIAQLRRFEQRLVVSLTDLELVSLPFDIPCSGSETDNAYDAVEKCLAEANRLPRDNVAHMLHPEEEIPDRKKRTYFMFRTPYETQSGVLDSDLKPIIEGIKKALDKKEEGRKMVLPIKWKGCVVFTEGRIDNIKEWNRSPSNITAVSLDSW